MICGLSYRVLLANMGMFSTLNQGLARTQSPTTTNYAVEIPTFGEFARVSKARGAMAEPRRGWPAFLIAVSPLPGKYELYMLLIEESTDPQTRPLLV